MKGPARTVVSSMAAKAMAAILTAKTRRAEAGERTVANDRKQEPQITGESDGNGGVAQALVTITVNPINDAPVTSDVVLNAQADSAGLIIDDSTLLANDTDADGDALALIGLTQPSNGFVSLNPDGTIVYIPTTGFVGLDSFTYTVSDPSGAQATGLVVIDVTTADGSVPGIGGGNGGNGGNGGGIVIEPDESGCRHDTAGQWIRLA